MTSDGSPSEVTQQTVNADVPTSSYKPLRVWPVAVMLIGMAFCRLMLNFSDVSPRLFMFTGILGPLVFGALILLWWPTFSRATIREKLVGFIGVLLALAVTLALCDKSMRGPGTIMLTIPIGTVLFGVGAIFMRRCLAFKRTWNIILLAAVGFGFSVGLRNDGMWGNAALGLDWRWNATPEEKMLAKQENIPQVMANRFLDNDAQASLAKPEWPRFRGANGLSQQHGTRIATDWKSHPPTELWKMAVGPGWSSFAVAGELLFTQEQRGENEIVVCYEAATGKTVWVHELQARFDDALGGPGPRATPTIANGAIYALGASGDLHRLNPLTGEVVWKKSLCKVADRDIPEWGYASSPLVIDVSRTADTASEETVPEESDKSATESLVIVHAGGPDDKGTLAFDSENGELVWSAPAGDHSYSSPQLGILHGKPVVLMLTNWGLRILDPQTGVVQLEYELRTDGYRVMQPVILADNSILFSSSDGGGTFRLLIEETADGLKAKDVWASKKLKPDFNDFVVHDGNAYGFDGRVFTCIDLKTGERQWKRGRYGKGQVLLLVDSELLLVVTEMGQVVLVETNPTKHKELARFQALEGKTWNHPVVVNDRLYLRNSQEAACYQLPLAKPTETDTPETTDAISMAN